LNKLKSMEQIKYSGNKDWNKILQRPVADLPLLEKKVSKILASVRRGGDRAVSKFILAFDKADLKSFLVTEKEFEEAEKKISKELKTAIGIAKKNIERFHSHQLRDEAVLETMPGIKCWRRNVPIEKVGLYIPGGSAPLFSTLLMLGIPAVIAGCKLITVCSPSDRSGKLHPAILFVARILGIKNVFKIGGVQAIAAMRYGTETVPAVNKIFGPGNQYITCAKQLIQQDGFAIDLPAGPSEVAVFADESAEPAFVAADLLSQAEHGPDSQVVLLSVSADLLNKTRSEISRQLINLPRKAIAEQSLKKSKMILVQTPDQALEILNAYAPEHLILSCRQPEWMAKRVLNAGSVFLGNYSPESAGDYASGTNHTLPTNGFAKSHSGVSVESFVRKISFQQLTRDGFAKISKTIEVMATAEGLEGHARAAKIRLDHEFIR
jgi:histidinol dehydrogenase